MYDPEGRESVRYKTGVVSLGNRRYRPRLTVFNLSWESPIERGLGRGK
jgi:hypothetical protein